MMIKGMTGFGSATFVAENIRGIVEVKSVNHRYLDISYYLPIGFASIERKIRQVVDKFVSRGRINIALKIFDKPAQTAHFNTRVVASYMRHAKALKRQFKLTGELTLSDVVLLPGVAEARETEVSPEALWPAIEKSLTKAMASVATMRQREGKSLGTELNAILSRMLLKINQIRKRAAALIKAKRHQLPADEFASFQKSVDINEELSRLAHHVAECRLLLKSDVAVGKKLDFVAQEMQRETNTIGSKLQDKIVANAVVSLKSKIEKLREQSQNIE